MLYVSSVYYTTVTTNTRQGYFNLDVNMYLDMCQYSTSSQESVRIVNNRSCVLQHVYVHVQ